MSYLGRDNMSRLLFWGLLALCTFGEGGLGKIVVILTGGHLSSICVPRHTVLFCPITSLYKTLQGHVTIPSRQ